MSWITGIWSLTAGICLALGGVYLLVWTRRRERWANLVFSVSAGAAAGYAVLEMLAQHDRTPASYGHLWRWAFSLGMLEGVLIALFIRLHLRAGRWWLFWLICGLRALMLVLNFVAGPNFYFREISGLQQVPLLGELISRPHGVLHPWVMLMPLSFLLLILFAIDAAHTAAKRGGHPRAWALGGLMAVGFSLALVAYALYAREILPTTFSSQLFLSFILLMGYELSLEVLRAGQLSQELRESQQRMRMAAKAADISLWEYDLAQDEIWVTEKGRERAGVGPSERISLARFLQAVHPDDQEETRLAVTRSLEGGGDFEAEYRIMGPNATAHWVVSRGQLERNANGKPVRLRGVSVDITPRRRTEAELHRLQGELAHLARVSTMGQLASSLAHELSQPLGAILRNTEAAELFLQRDSPDLEEIRTILADIRRDNQRAGAVIDGMRSMIKRREPECALLDMNSVVSEVIALARLDAEARRIHLALTPAAQVPAVRADRIQLQQVVLNLVLNALDAMSDLPPQHRQVSIRVSCSDGSVEVDVRDAGRGIPEANLQRVFDPFFTTKPGGLGMGLAISQTILARHGGRLTAQNNATGGATFRMSLPGVRPESHPS